MTATSTLSSSFVSVSQELFKNGWTLLRNPEQQLADFSVLMSNLCQTLTFDPARVNSSVETQKVDAGRDAVGLHIENGNTPLAPDLIGFFSEKSAKVGSQTTICDGVKVVKQLPSKWLDKFSKPMTVSRYLPPKLWKKYVANALSITDLSQIGSKELELFISKIPNQSFNYVEDGGVQYTLQFAPIRTDNCAKVPAFANALLGPSYNYETPIYRFHDGSLMSSAHLQELHDMCEKCIMEIDWQDGDIALIDNKRVLHGRRKIDVPLAERTLHIGMGLNISLQLQEG